MKKLFVALISSVMCCLMLFLLVGCGEKDGEREVLPQGTLCTLENAYSGGCISKQELESIAECYNSDENVYSPASLSAETRQGIKQAYFEEMNGEARGANVDDVNIGGYYGTYSGYSVVILNASCMSPIGGDPRYYPEYEIDGVIFKQYTLLWVWKEIDK